VAFQEAAEECGSAAGSALICRVESPTFSAISDWPGQSRL
jgi:hypothetical protein